jgi:hypothetical protein
MTSRQAINHREGGLARPIEDVTARIPSDFFLWLACGSIALSLGSYLMNKKSCAMFVGQWVPTFLLFGVYNKIVKVAGHDELDGKLKS